MTARSSMNVILVPGFWLGAWSWSPVSAALVDAGHAVHPLTLPGMDSVQTDRTGITLADHVAAVVAEIDEIVARDETAQIVLVAHSGGGPIGYGAADQRVERVSRIVYVDSGPLADGLAINPNIPEVDGEMPLPPWDFFEVDELVGLTPELLDEFRANAVPEPRHVSRDALRIRDPRRRGIPSTVITCTLAPDQLKQYAEAGVPFLAELAALTDTTVVSLPTGHWPQFSRPDDLAALIVATVTPGA